MSGAERRNALDSKDRDRIRAALKRYMKAHKIGVPALKLRIEGSTPSAAEFPQKTLQRFLSDTHRTSDGYVAALYEFIKETKYWRDQDEVEEFGEAFFSLLNPGVKPRAACFNRNFFKSFHITETRVPLRDNLYHPLPTYKRFRIPPDEVGWIKFDFIGNPAYLRALEVRPLETPDGVYSPRRKTYEGVLVAAQNKFFVILRDTLTHAPRMYELSAAVDIQERNKKVEVLVGACFRTSVVYSPDDGDGSSKHRYVHLMPEPTNEALQAAV